MEELVCKRPRLSPEPTSFQSDIVAELHQAKGKSSHRRRATTPASSSKVECKEIEASKESLHQELDQKKLDVANFLKADLEEEDPEEEEDLEEEEDPKEEEDLEEFSTEV
ncbi:hypothetical protein FNV43_RR03510 [Rhamnella rubrinervis]|uniref:Uncharacterized protein n=1 Tax=Rhamnella rubrinervis TaxID=2594499 RepID=A0A8K0HHU7_9ROSA|nr:hypothetical protein FNV43_RR03510 [Rhamnella rubrinervis]